MTSVAPSGGNAVALLALETGAAMMGAMAAFRVMQIAAGFTQGGAFTPAARQMTATMPASGQADVDLGDGASLEINEASSSITIHEANGHSTQIWGDPHVNVDGKAVGDLYGATTFELQDGTKISIGMQPSATKPGIYYADKVTITRGAQAVVIAGVSEQTRGDLSISAGLGGRALDALTPDGLVLNARNDGGWNSSITGERATQADFDTTRPGLGGAVAFGHQLGVALGQFLATGRLSPMLGGEIAGDLAERAGRPHPGHVAHAVSRLLAELEA